MQVAARPRRAATGTAYTYVHIRYAYFYLRTVGHFESTWQQGIRNHLFQIFLVYILWTMSEKAEADSKGSEMVEVEHVINQKDIQDFWDHVTTEERIKDVCTTFTAESKLVTSKLFAQNASVPEKFAVANFLLQVGALKFQVQSSPTEPNVYHTVIILQKPDTATSADNDASSPPPPPGQADKDHAVVEDEGSEPGNQPIEESDDEDAPWKKDPETEGEEFEDPSKEEQPPKTPEHHECPHCDTVFTSLWDLDLHVLGKCTGVPRRRGRPRKKPRVEEKSPSSPPTHSVSSDVGISKRKRGRPRKVITESTVDELPTVPEDTQATEESPAVRLTRNGRVRRMPLKLLDTVRDTKNHKQNRNSQGAKTKTQEKGGPKKIQKTIKRTEQQVPEQVKQSSSSESEEKLAAPCSKEDCKSMVDSKKEKKKKQCEICFKMFPPYYLAQHVSAVHQQKKKFKCSTCKKTFGFKPLFRSHLLAHRNLATNNLYVCDICETAFPDKYILKRHMPSHEEKGKVKCDFCDKTFPHESIMQRHRNSVHTKETIYPCTLCDKVFYLKHRLRDHMVSHSGKKEFKCDLCDMEFFLFSRLKSHKKYVHIEGRPFLCAMCGSSFKSKTTLKQHHLTAHTDVKNFPCRQCGKPFARSSLRNQHEKVHAGHNPFPCEHCGKGFRDKCKLQVHINWHLGVRPFECDVCHKKFLIKGNLTKHSRLHTGERPYVCSECGHGCVDSSQLKKHMAQHHGIHITRQLTKGPERIDGALPSKRMKRQHATSGSSKAAAEEGEEKTDGSDESRAFTIATDALIEISQQLVECSAIQAAAGQVTVDNSTDPSVSGLQHGLGEVVSTAVQGTAENEKDVFPVLVNVNQDNQVAVPVTQSIGDFQSLELISL